jgi:predicted acetyltransferase
MTETRAVGAIDVRPIHDDELEAWFEAASTAFFVWPSDPPAQAAFRRERIDFARTLGAFEDDRIVGTFRSFATELTLPGLARLPVGAITAVTVRPTHRRRGILTKMMDDDLGASIEREEAASILVSAEYPIYGRFGFGHATDEGRYTMRTRQMRFHGETSGSVEILPAAPARPIVAEVYQRYRAASPGEIDRPAWRHDVELGLLEQAPQPRWKGQVAIHRDASGEPDGYVRYHGAEHWDEGIPDNELIVDELLGVTRDAQLELWRYLAQMDLVATITASMRPIDDPVRWALVDGRASRLTGRYDFLWLRPLDLERLLSSRSYEHDGRLTIGVVDRLSDGTDGPTAGRWELDANADGGTARRTTGDPDLTVPVGALGAALLGGSRLSDAVLSTGHDEHTKGALALADRILRTARAPWCSTGF